MPLTETSNVSPHAPNGGTVSWIKVRETGHAIDRYIGELARRGCSTATRQKYFRVLAAFADTTEDRLTHEVTVDDCRRFLDRYTSHAPATLALHVTVLRTFFAFLKDEGTISENPMDRVRRPRLGRAEDKDVVTVGTRDVLAMLAACEIWQERICLGVLVYLGPRRSAAAKLRWRDVDTRNGTIRFREKGGKVIVKPMPDELAQLLAAGAASGEIPCSGIDYVIPNRRAASVRRRGERSSKVVWETVRIVAQRAGVRAHPHALRAAFATAFLEQHGTRLTALQALMGHARIETTLVYLRRLDRGREMDTVRGLTWTTSAAPEGTADATVGGTTGAGSILSDLHDELAARRAPFPAEQTWESARQGARTETVFPSSPGVPHTGFEPVLPPQAPNDAPDGNTP